MRFFCLLALFCSMCHQETWLINWILFTAGSCRTSEVFRGMCRRWEGMCKTSGKRFLSFHSNFCLLMWFCQRFSERWLPRCHLLAMTGSHSSSRHSLPSPQLSSNACEAKSALRAPSFWNALPKGNSSKNPLLAGALTSAETSGQDNSTPGVMAETKI